MTMKIHLMSSCTLCCTFCLSQIYSNHGSLFPEKLQKKYGELSGDIHLVDLSTGSNGLGLSLAGNKDRNLMSAFVAGIQPESTAAKDGRITVGDELLEVSFQTAWNI